VSNGAVTNRENVSISVLGWVPEGGRGLVRDLRVRWALEEAEIPYSVRKLEFLAPRSPEYLAEHPFGQVPVYRDGEVSLFESGAIVLHIAEKSEALLPRDAQERARAISWIFAALSSVELSTWPYATLGVFFAGQDWVQEAKPGFEANARSRLERVAAYLGDKEWLEDRFTAGDLMMVTVLRVVARTGILGEFPTLAAYQARGEARPAFKRALAAQLADFEDRPAAA
jgi:glutathione S-transferase